jgi:hypothetical protein
LSFPVLDPAIVSIAETGCDAENLARQFLNLALDCGGRDASAPDGAARLQRALRA